MAWLAGAGTITMLTGESTVATLAAPVELLQASGLTPTDVLALTALRERVQRGRVAEDAIQPAQKRDFQIRSGSIQKSRFTIY